MEVLKLDGVNKAFGGNKVIQNLSLILEGRKIYALLGSNGAGKTTLLNIINGQVKSDSGNIIFNNYDVTYCPTYKRSELGVLRLWQHGNIFQNMSVLDNLLAAPPQLGENLWNYIVQHQSIKQQKKEHLQLAYKILETLELENKATNLSIELSYGQQRLLAFGRILMSPILNKGKGLILVDEPFAGVHQTLIEKIIIILKDLSSKGNTILVIEHNIDKMLTFSNEVLLMQDGYIIQQLTKEEFNPTTLQQIYTVI